MSYVRTLALPLAAVLMTLFASLKADAQQPGLDRLPSQVFDVMPPSARVRGVPGEMATQSRACRTLPTAETRRRLVSVAVQ